MFERFLPYLRLRGLWLCRRGHEPGVYVSRREMEKRPQRPAVAYIACVRCRKVLHRPKWGA